MGNSASTSPELLRLQKRFSPEELEELKHLFFSLAAQSRSGGTHIIASVFQAYFGIHGPLGSRLFDHIAREDEDELLSFEEFVAAKAVADKGSEEELEHFAFSVADVLHTGSITRLEAEAVVESALLTVFGVDTISISDDLVAAFVNSAKFSGPKASLEAHPLCRVCSSTSFFSGRKGQQQGPQSDEQGLLQAQGRSASFPERRQGGESPRTADDERMGRAEPPMTAEEDQDSCSEPGASPSDHVTETEDKAKGQEHEDTLHSGPDLHEKSDSDKVVATASDSQSEGHGSAAESIDAPTGGRGDKPPAPRRDSKAPVRCPSDCGRHPSMTETDFRSWMERVPVVRKFLRSLLASPGPTRSLPGRLVPPLEWPKQAKGAAEDGAPPPPGSMAGAPLKKGGRFLMREELAWHLSSMLQEKEIEGPWRLVYSSSLHGLSFSTFMGKVSDMPVPGVILIRDKQGALFGSVFSQPLQRRSSFYGDMRTFLFSFLPAAAIYKPSGLNQNTQWCATGFKSESIPNGVGFGGQTTRFGLYLDSTFDKGQSWPCMTFHSPSLASQPYFEVDVVECWSIGQPEEDEANQGGNKKSQLKGTVLDRFKEEKALLGFSGIATNSDTLSKEDTS